MKYLKQFGIILTVTFAGEILNTVIPLPIPASVYGIILLFGLLLSGILKKESIREVSGFLTGILPIMFVAPSAGILDAWGILKPVIFQYLLLCIVVTVAILFVAGHVTQFMIRSSRRGADPASESAGSDRAVSSASDGQDNTKGGSGHA